MVGIKEVDTTLVYPVIIVSLMYAVQTALNVRLISITYIIKILKSLL